jgi:hypothetical protein
MFLTSIFKRKNGDDEGVIIAFRNRPKTESKSLFEYSFTGLKLEYAIAA